MLERYSRQILFDGIGEAGQQRLLDARAVIIGCGALGTAQAEALARAGVGSLRIVDRDFVEWHVDVLFRGSGISAERPRCKWIKRGSWFANDRCWRFST